MGDESDAEAVLGVQGVQKRGQIAGGAQEPVGQHRVPCRTVVAVPGRCLGHGEGLGRKEPGIVHQVSEQRRNPRHGCRPSAPRTLQVQA